MNKILSLLILSLMLGALTACSDSSEEIVIQEVVQQEDIIPVGTRIGDFIVSYYWFKGGKVPIYLHDNSCMIIYHTEDEEIIVTKLEEMGLSKDNMRSKADYILYPNGYENPSKAIYDYQDTKRATIGINYKQALKIPEIVYATPCVSTDISTDKVYPLSNFIYIEGNDFNKIEKKANELNVDIIGRIRGVVGDYYSAACNKESTGNPLEVAILFRNAGILAEPIFLNAAGGSITD